MKQIRESKFSKIVAYYLMIMMFLQVTQPMQMYAITSGPTQPEFNSFTPIGTSDMVDLASGDFNYNIPIMDVGGYPLNLSYNSGITMDQEASWVGLGWNLNVGQIERQMRGLPDDFKGDVVTYENDARDNVTVGMNLAVNGAVFGWDGITPGVGLGVESNNYEGISFKPSFGVGFQLNDNVTVGLNLSSSVAEGATVTPSVSLSAIGKESNNCSTNSLTGALSLGFNSRKGVENLNLSASVSRKGDVCEIVKNKEGKDVSQSTGRTNSRTLASIGGSISFNNQSYTPSKRIGYENSSFAFNGALGSEYTGAEGQVQVTGYGSYQKIHPDYKNRDEKAYGYENTEYKKDESGILDFNREKERTVTENTLALALPNYTYDTYVIEGQGVSGMFRPYRSKVSSLYNDKVEDNGDSKTFGAEFGLGQLVHGGLDFKNIPSISRTGPWVKNNNVLPYFSERDTDAKGISYEPCTYKLVGGMVVDPNQSIYEKILGARAINIGIKGGKRNGSTIQSFFEKGSTIPHAISEVKRTKRFLRNQVIQKITNEEAKGDAFVKNRTESFVKPHHTAGIKVLQTDGSTYVFGKTAYNIKKIEATFDVSGATTGNNTNGLVEYTTDSHGELSGNDSNVSDKFLNRITTNGFAHSFLLSSVLSSDYEDVDDNGPTINDLGSFTQFEYTQTSPNYKWRVPFGKNKATFNDGLISNKHDQKGNYIYGEKELVYLDKIVTKTHVAFFDLGDREDAIGVLDKNGDEGPDRMKFLKSIRLYSRPEVTNSSGVIVDPGASGTVKAIKVAHFEYNYALCQQTPNSKASGKGKLTLAKVYFTYRGSNMGKYTPYVFNYNEGNSISNPIYNPKGFDVWGNYKENPLESGYINTPLSNTEFPFVEQNKTTADNNTRTWTLRSIDLPSGGKIAIETESDDYQFVQNKKAMQMFKVMGCGATSTPSTNDALYNENAHSKYLYVKVSDALMKDKNNDTYDSQDFIDQYLSENYEKAIQFRFLLNMMDNNEQYDYVSGYFEIDRDIPIGITSNSTDGTIAAIPLKYLRRDGGTNGKAPVNPITKTAWGFGRTYLNRFVYGIDSNPAETDFATIINNLRGSIDAIKTIFTGPNLALQNKNCARKFKPEKSWIRLENPDGKKLGGGLRVKSIKLSDQWDVMVSPDENDNDMEYGQTYSYEDQNHKSTGVATFEPNSCAENPLVEPFYNRDGNHAENIAAPKENNYLEKPFGENFFPAPRVTYAKVAVKNMEHFDQGRPVKKHATGIVVTEHFTTYDFPTKVEVTDIKAIPQITDNNIILQMITNNNINVRNHLTMSQGYAIETNDMNGKIKSQKIYAENQKDPEMLSSVEYEYNVDENGNLDNNLTTIDSKGHVEKRLIGLDYDMINDFNETYASTRTVGFDGNFASFIIPPEPVPVFIPTIFPRNSYNENQLRTAVTVKHVHKTGILMRKIATDGGATVSTKNLGWDAESGEVILTETMNEYGDHYYSFTYPAYWMYDGMGLASQNIGTEGYLKAMSIQTPPGSSPNASSNPYFAIDGHEGIDLKTVFHVGDELYAKDTIIQSPQSYNPTTNRVWVVGFNKLKTGVLLIDRSGKYVNKCNDLNKIHFKIMRSGYRNLQSASMASVTSMINPLKDTDEDGLPDTLDQNSFAFDQFSSFNPRIVNSSAVVYQDFWPTQSEANMPYYPIYDLKLVSEHVGELNGELVSWTKDTNPVTSEELPKYPYNTGVNPYVWNVKGEWRAERSYAYLTGRNANNGQINNPRNEGFYKNFSPFYQLSDGAWKIDETNWTNASSVSKYSPYGVELENKDALKRYSAAQYGYQYKLPMAVASNSKYEQMGYEGFEEKKQGTSNSHFGFIINNENNITNQHSHTGKSSLKVSKGQSKFLSRNLFPYLGINTIASCQPYTPSSNGVCPTRGVLSIGGTGLISTTDIVSIAFCLPHENGSYPTLLNNREIQIHAPTTGTGGRMYLKVVLNDANQSIKYLTIDFNPNGTWRHVCDDSGYLDCNNGY